jgi:hypothetical protein
MKVAEADPVEVEKAALMILLTDREKVKTKRDAQALAPRIQALPEKERAEVMVLYGVATKELK